jgi:pyridoxamine 5'-phosphate oxidase
MITTDAIEHPSWLTTGDFTAADEPFRLFATWFEEATRKEATEANAMAVATVDPEGLPNVRMVLLKGFDERGFVFYTNETSRKGQELAASRKAALAFHWPTLKHQVRVRGPVEIVADAEADAYYASRPRLSQIAAWASKQSSPLENRLAFETRVAAYTAKYALGAVPRPEFWIGFRIVPMTMEFWADRPFRMHDRIEFRRDAVGGTWTKTRLYP